MTGSAAAAAAAAAATAAAVPRVDAWRSWPAGPASDGAAYKEWMHFCVRLPGAGPDHLLVNLNVTETASPSGGAARTPRLIALASLSEGAARGWSGDVESFAPGQVRGAPGLIDLRLGESALAWRDGAFVLSLRTRALEADLRLRPVAAPTVATSVSFGPAHAMHWVVIPRLEADGWVRAGGRRLAVERAPAYHDHNWGRFRWGGDLAWEWGFVNPDDPACPWSAVLVRVSDGRRARTLAQGLLLWRGDRLVRTFQNGEVRVALSGSRRGPRPFTLPRIAALLAPGASTGVPARLEAQAAGAGAGAGDRLSFEFDTAAAARVAIPSDVDGFRLVMLNETCGRARVRGVVPAGTIDFEGPAVMEFVRG